MPITLSPYRGRLPRWLEEVGANPFIGAGPLAAAKGPQMIRFPLGGSGKLVRGWGNRELADLARQMGHEGPPPMIDSTTGNTARPISPKVLSLGRYRGGDTVKPHHPIEEAMVEGRRAIDLTALKKLLDVLWSHTEVPPKLQLPW